MLILGKVNPEKAEPKTSPDLRCSTNEVALEPLETEGDARQPPSPAGPQDVSEEGPALPELQATPPHPGNEHQWEEDQGRRTWKLLVPRQLRESCDMSTTSRLEGIQGQNVCWPGSDRNITGAACNWMLNYMWQSAQSVLPSRKRPDSGRQTAISRRVTHGTGSP